MKCWLSGAVVTPVTTSVTKSKVVVATVNQRVTLHAFASGVARSFSVAREVTGDTGMRWSSETVVGGHRIYVSIGTGFNSMTRVFN